MRSFLKKMFPESVLSYVIASVAITAIVFIFFGVTKIESDSMVPTLRDGDRVLYFRFSSPKRFGIFFIDDPKNENRKLVKRIIGLPGERIESYHAFSIIPPNHFYVLGDHKEEYWGNDIGETVISLDSRSFGPIHHINIHERVVLVYWPPFHARWLW